MGPLDAPAPDALVLALGSAPASTDELFKQFMKAYLETQTSVPVQTEPQDQFLKARIPNLYYGNSHMDCYRVCQ